MEATIALAEEYLPNSLIKATHAVSRFIGNFRKGTIGIMIVPRHGMRTANVDLPLCKDTPPVVCAVFRDAVQAVFDQAATSSKTEESIVAENIAALEQALENLELPAL
jgi:hypothetical protein